MTRLERWLVLGFIVCVWALMTTRAQQGSPTLPSYPLNVHIVNTGFTPVKPGPGTLHSLTVNTAGASSVITIYDTATCSGSPSVTKAIITLPASGVLPGSLLNDGAFANGICVNVATAASDMTATAF